MQTESSSGKSKETGACTGCGLQDTCQTGAVSDGPFRGLSLIVAAAGYFLFPLAMALAGAMALAHSPFLQFVGGASGLAVGMLVATFVARRFCIEAQRGAAS